ncbi:hypothetical protein KOI35_42075 [Actinoplanes bogorensis]|uniref:Sensor histidine kinase n=1 Tax=Paractinoplanes bogorensis TaxID=1610840 RepID=A0ABS5Z343_9ACTN|nr:hypothetical protein [Actinoplanes bogorensis]MBU2670115.1 hypothetical protein [Actinoplanes bogorensis]
MKTLRALPKGRIAAGAGAVYLAYGGATYLDLKSGLPTILCWVGGLLLGLPFALLADRPLLTWRLTWLACAVTGLAVQAHHRTPFSWHPALLAAQLVILVVISLRFPYAVSAWTYLSMVALIALSFYSADWLPISLIVAVIMGVAVLIGATRRRAQARRAIA